MKKIIVLSDSHNNTYGISKLIPIMAEADYIITLGDMQSDYNTIIKLFKDKVYAVKGNCDYNSLEEERLIEIEDVRMLITHGHIYRVKDSLNAIIIRAEELQADAVIYGHTHMADIDNMNNIKLINPGAMRAGYETSYCYIVASNGKIYPTIVRLP